MNQLTDRTPINTKSSIGFFIQDKVLIKPTIPALCYSDRKDPGAPTVSRIELRFVVEFSYIFV